MKRFLALVPVVLLSACGGGGEQQNKAAAEVTAIAPGQYQVTREVTAFRATDRAATPQINTPAGTRTTETICVGPGEQPPGELFAGAGSECTYGNHYLRRGSINSSLTCRREGLNGEIRMTAYGSITADGFQVDVDTTTYFAGEGDAVFTTRTTGRRTGDCQPAPEDGNSSQAATK